MKRGLAKRGLVKRGLVQSTVFVMPWDVTHRDDVTHTYSNAQYEMISSYLHNFNARQIILLRGVAVWEDR